MKNILKHSKYLLITAVVLVALGRILCVHTAHALGLNEGLLGVRNLHAGHLLEVRILIGAGNGAGDVLEESLVVAEGEFFATRNIELIEKYFEILKIFTCNRRITGCPGPRPPCLRSSCTWSRRGTSWCKGSPCRASSPNPT